MKSILVLIAVLVPSFAQAQNSLTLKYSEPYLMYDGVETNTALEQSRYTVRVYHNSNPPIAVPFQCEGTVKPFQCKAPSLPLEVGNNVLYITIQPPPINGVSLPESPKSNPLVVFFALNQKEIIINTQRQSLIRCTPGSYQMTRITDATKLLAIVNGVTTYVSNILATANAIYVFSCTPVMESVE